MSIASAITDAQDRVAAAYTAISNMGGTLPATQNLSNMPTAINSIPTGGGDHGGKYHICVYDDLGNILKEDHLNAGATFEMPSPPTRDGLTFVRWVSGAPISNGNITMPDYEVLAAPIYTTNSNKVEITIETFTSNCPVSFAQNAWETGYTVDWGDGSSVEDLSEHYTHTYTSPGIYKILLSVSEEAYSEYGVYISTDSMAQYFDVKEFNCTNYVGGSGGKFQIQNPDPQYWPNCIFRPTNAQIYFSPNPSLINIIPNTVIGFYNNINCIGPLIVDYDCTYNNTNSSTQFFNSKYTHSASTYTGLAGGLSYVCDCEITCLATSLTSEQYVTGTCYNNSYYLKNIISVPQIKGNSNTIYYSKRDTFYVPFNLWYNFINDPGWGNGKQIIKTKTPVTINPVLNQGDTLTVFGKSITSQFINYGDKFNFTYNDGVNTYSGIYSGLVADSTVTINFSSLSYKQITISCGVSGLTIYSDFVFTDNNDGTYSANIYSNNSTLQYTIDGGASYMDYNGTIDLTQQSPITDTVTLVPATETSFTQPTLSANGTLGGANFAVASDNISTTTVYRAFDNKDNTTWGQSSTSYTSTGSAQLIIYNPTPIKVSEIDFITSSTTASYPQTNANQWKWQGSSDGANWTDLTYSTANDPNNANIRVLTFSNNNNFYKYYRLIRAGSTTWVQAFNLNKQINIIATYKIPAS